VRILTYPVRYLGVRLLREKYAVIFRRHFTATLLHFNITAL